MAKAGSDTPAATTRVQLCVATERPAACPAARRKYCIRSVRRGPRWRPAKLSTKVGPPMASTIGSYP
eukprot:2245328-Lingulodinium_polyedra.AAC.1